MSSSKQSKPGIGHNSQGAAMSGDKTKVWHTPAKQSWEEAAAANTGPGRHLHQLNWLIEIIFDPRLGETPVVVKFLAAAVKYNNRETGTAFPGLKVLAEDIYRDLMQLPPKTAEAIMWKVASLARACGYILSRRQAPPGGGRAVSHYTFSLPDPDERGQAIAIYHEWLAEENAKRVAKKAGASDLTAPVRSPDLTAPARSPDLTAPVISEGGCPNRHQGSDLTAADQNRPPHFILNLDLNLLNGADAPGGEDAGATEELNQDPKVKARSSPKRATPATAAAVLADAVAAFERFWAAFPPGRKTAKGDTRDLFVAIVTGKHKKRRASAEVIVAAAERYAATRPDPQYTPMPTTWLNGGRWEDDACQPKRQAVTDEQAEYLAAFERVRKEQGLA